MIPIEVGFKFYIYQILFVLVIWLGMTYFLDDISGAPKIIYYVVTGWLLFLILVTIREFFERKREKEENKDDDKK